MIGETKIDIGRIIQSVESFNKTMTVPPQVSRLILITLCIIAGYFTARHFLVPPSFGQYGWYRGDALKEIASRPISFAGKKSCLECHAAIGDAMSSSLHKKISCEACHKAGASHAEDPTENSMPKITNPKFCLRCHLESPSLPAKFPRVDAADHYSDQVCMDCHLPHTPKDAPK